MNWKSILNPATLGLLLLTAAGARAATCPINYSTSPDQVSVTAGGAYGSFRVNVPAGCVWSAVPMYPWTVITSAATFNGPGTVTYYVAGNPGAARDNFVWIIGTTPGPNGSTTRGRLYITQK